MGKETYYFSHDYGARNDPKLIKLLMKEGMTGIGIYWCLIEMLFEQQGNLFLSECETYAFALRTEYDALIRVINDYGLFVTNDVVFYSESVNRRLKQREDKSEKARNSAGKRWNNADAMQTQCEGNAIKERKGKEIKGNKRKGKEIKGKENTVFDFVDILMSDSFYNWLEYKKESGRGYKSEKSIRACYKHLLNLAGNDTETAKKIIEQSIANNWAGLFELKNGKQVSVMKQINQNPQTDYSKVGTVI